MSHYFGYDHGEDELIEKEEGFDSQRREFWESVAFVSLLLIGAVVLIKVAIF